MDNQKFGNFIACIRKEKGWTQQELADKLYVTNKTISKWERGLGFPDIKTIEPLAKALGVSMIEIMSCERIQESLVTTEQADETITDVIDVLAYQRKIEKRNIIIAVITAATFIMLVFLIDEISLFGFMAVVLPIICFAVGIILFVISIRSYILHNKNLKLLIISILFLLVPVALLLFLVLGFVLGLGPIPS